MIGLDLCFTDRLEVTILCEGQKELYLKEELEELDSYQEDFWGLGTC